MPQGFDISTLVLLLLAGFVVWRLRSVLGQRTGADRPPMEPPIARRESPVETPRGNDNVIPLPTSQPRQEAPQTPEQRWKGITDPAGPAVAGLEAITASDRSFSPRAFVEGARMAYEMIVTAFAKGDKDALKDLLSADVLESFAGVIDGRANRGETAESTFVSIDESSVLSAELDGTTAEITVKFVSKIINAVKDASGEVIEGSATKAADTTDVWTFARDTKSRDPNWKVVATDSEG
jgi:predicted lipid-binding transport protein (Tim44 family)